MGLFTAMDDSVDQLSVNRQEPLRVRVDCVVQLLIEGGPSEQRVDSFDRLSVDLKNYSMFPLAFVAGSLQGCWWGFVGRSCLVWPVFFLMNVFIALNGTHFLSFICLHCSWCCAVWRP